jgi:hypothetical protein
VGIGLEGEACSDHSFGAVDYARQATNEPEAAPRLGRRHNIQRSQRITSRLRRDINYFLNAEKVEAQPVVTQSGAQESYSAGTIPPALAAPKSM